MFYLIAISAAAIVIAAVNFLMGGAFTLFSFGKELLITVLCVVAVIAIDGIVAFAVRRMPERWFSPEARFFSVGKRERKIYRGLGVNWWKRYVPELGCFTGFHKDRIQEPTSSAYIGRFLMESNYGALGHVLGSVLGFAIIFIPFIGKPSVSVPVAVINFILSNMPTIILRYNTPSLRSLYRRALDREKRKSEANMTEIG